MHELSQGKTALITGASGGIGRQFVKQCIASGMHVVAVNRTCADAKECDNPEVFPSLPRLESIGIDLLDPNGVRALVATLDAQGTQIDLLINCAGKGLLSPFESVPYGAQRALARLNFEVPVELTHSLLPGLKARGGAVLNIASLAAFVPLPNMSVLGASKAALLQWSVALRRELLGSVSVTAFCPGITRPPFLRTAKMDHLNLDKWFFACEPAVVARRALDAVARNRAVAFATNFDRVLATLAQFIPSHYAAAAIHSVLTPPR